MIFWITIYMNLSLLKNFLHWSFYWLFRLSLLRKKTYCKSRYFPHHDPHAPLSCFNSVCNTSCAPFWCGGSCCYFLSQSTSKQKNDKWCRWSWHKTSSIILHAWMVFFKKVWPGALVNMCENDSFFFFCIECTIAGGGGGDIWVQKTRIVVAEVVL